MDQELAGLDTDRLLEALQAWRNAEIDDQRFEERCANVARDWACGKIAIAITSK